MATEIKTKKVVLLPETLRSMTSGESLELKAKTVGFSTARSAVCRLNKDGRNGRFEITTVNNGYTYTITRIA